MVRNHLLGELRSRLSRHFTYPDVARSRGWEGTVLVALRVEPDGLLDAIQIGRSSGYDVLDRAALRSLRGIERLGEVTELLAGRKMDLELAVVYRLAGR